MAVSDPCSRDRSALHSCYSAKKGTKVPRKCSPRWKTRTKAEEEEEEEGSHWGSLVQGDPAAENWTGEGENSRLDSPRRQPMPPEAQGWCPWLGVTIVPPDTVHRPPSPAAGTVADALETKPACLLWFVFTRPETTGKRNPGVVPCRYILLLKARKVYFSVTQWRHAPERRGEKSKDTETVTLESESEGLRFTTASML